MQGDIPGGGKSMTPVWRRGILAALGTACPAGITQAGEHVDWLDDSKVMLKLGPTYGDAVIESNPAWHPVRA
jgi:hypothetical protein